MRLQKYLADCGVASRRKCEELIKQGRIKINGSVVSELGIKVNDGDKISFDDKIVSLKGVKVYYMLNKPEGYITSVTDDRGRQTVIDLVPDKSERVFPVGRLDYQTSGMLLLTNDGDFAYKMTHPKHIIPKTYVAKVKGEVSKESIELLKNGVRIENYITSKAKVEVVACDSYTTSLQITIHEGKNRQIRKMCTAVGHNVISLKRVAIGNIGLNDLRLGNIRKLTCDELKYLNNL
ncbi:MAG: pseudouridine synthase [Epulopiscium sp. Nele67-Bin002]|nr:MAG: pseudouridine synthase [Epulopiscium sp. Nuni2H_MBin001]OON91310.1 MAG: pseudouridine synthase [Epulopiscium sp. Nele67-Bin002]OON94444.1 MAG: pseudouridine synthase [Epulopiscium sp. Nele67-Bin001]